MNRKKAGNRRDSTLADSRKHLLGLERGTYLKKWTGRLPVALLYPNRYRTGMSSLGFQVVYRLLNEDDRLVCERLFLPDKPDWPLVSTESGRPLSDFPVLFCSVSFEPDYLNLAAMLLAGGIEPYASKRSQRIEPGVPLVVLGGVAMFMNPEVLAPLADLILVGEAEPLLPTLIERLCGPGGLSQDRTSLCEGLNREYDGFYAPSGYRPHYDSFARFSGFRAGPGLPPRVRRVVLEHSGGAAHSELLTPETEFSELFLAELGRGCSRGCRFCTAGFIYRPPRLWPGEVVLESLRQRPENTRRVGLVGMEMTAEEVLGSVSRELAAGGCTLSFSSLRADRISDDILDLLEQGGVKSAAIAPDGCSERLRRVINKGLEAADILAAAEKLAGAGIARLKLYLMIGLPTETDQDLDEFLKLAAWLRERIDRVGRARGRLVELTVSLNCFIPKPWTPFQYHPFGSAGRLAAGAAFDGRTAAGELKRRIDRLKRGLKGLANTRVQSDRPDQALFQAVLARGDRRLAPMLVHLAGSGRSWKQALKGGGLSERLFATRQYGPDDGLPWEILDNSVTGAYLWREYQRAFEEILTEPCDPRICRRCGVCDGS